ncbi:hypothetical protein E4U14_006538, partial [Claviceps sp. LM454 group G7]
MGRGADAAEVLFRGLHRLLVDLRGTDDDVLYGGVPVILGGDFGRGDEPASLALLGYVAGGVRVEAEHEVGMGRTPAGQQQGRDASRRGADDRLVIT